MPRQCICRNNLTNLASANALAVFGSSLRNVLYKPQPTVPGLSVFIEGSPCITVCSKHFLLMVHKPFFNSCFQGSYKLLSKLLLEPLNAVLTLINGCWVNALSDHNILRFPRQCKNQTVKSSRKSCRIRLLICSVTYSTPPL